MTWEFHFLDKLQEILQNSFLDWFMPAVSSLGNAGFIWILLTILLLCIPKYRRIGIASAIALLINLLLCNLFLKPLIARTRPYDINTAVQLLIQAPHDYSFPSGHTSASFACALTLLFYDRKWGVPALVLAAVIAFSRLYLYVHFPTDVLGGMAVGLFSAFVSCRLMALRLKKQC